MEASRGSWHCIRKRVIKDGDIVSECSLATDTGVASAELGTWLANPLSGTGSKRETVVPRL
jgi:hypothetical protein